MNDNKRNADVSHRQTSGTSYRCHGCNRYIGDVNADGTLKVWGLVIVNVDGCCPHCGKIVHWRRDDISIENLRKNCQQFRAWVASGCPVEV